MLNEIREPGTSQNSTLPLGQAKKMDDYEGISVVDVYDIVTDFAKELRPIMEIYGAEPLNKIMSKVITILEHLEAQAVKIGKLNTLLQEKEAVISKLEKDKAEKAADRQRFEKELEQIEEHWRDESHEMVLMINRLQEENRKLVKSLAAKQDSNSVQASHPLSPEVDVNALQKTRASIDKLRDQLKMKDREIATKVAEIESMADQVERLTCLNKDLRKKQKLNSVHIRSLIDERADFLAQLQSQQYELNHLKQRLGIAEKENEDLAQQSKVDVGMKSMPDIIADDPKKPKFTSDELKDILQERNELKDRINELEDELRKYKIKDEKIEAEEEDDEDSIIDDEPPVQGPLPFEPNDAPWRKSESGIRKLFRKLFNEANVTLLGSSPKKNIPSLSKMSLSTNVSDSTL